MEIAKQRVILHAKKHIMVLQDGKDAIQVLHLAVMMLVEVVLNMVIP